MARTEIPIIDIIKDGTAEGAGVPGDPVNGMYFVPNDGNVFLEFENADPGPGSITVQVVASPEVYPDGGLLAVFPFEIEVPPSVVGFKAGNWNRKTYNQNVGTAGSVYVDLPDAAGSLLTVRGFRSIPAL